MKSLNRTLSLVLVLAMVFGLMGVASATSFKDDTTIQYQEAVGVMAGIGAINGYTDGTFAPKGTITREEAAKLITYTVLGATTAKTLTVSSTGFTDVAADRWSAPFITYLVSKGIINGMGDGTFDPTANVTGYQLAKMLLCALGYGAKGEFTGTSWELNTAVAANKQGILADSKATSFTVAATREEAALYCFNTLFINQVTYNKFFDSYADVYLASNSSRTIAYQVYRSLAVSETTSTDVFGRPAKVWVYGSPAKTIATVASTPILTYTTGVTVAALKLAVANAGYAFASTLPVVRNGGVINNYDVASAPGTDVLGGNGTALEVYADSTTGLVTKTVVVSTYAGAVIASNVTKDDPTTTTVDESALKILVPGLQSNPAIPTEITASAVAKTPGFAATYATCVAALASGYTQVPVLVTPNGDNSASSYALTVAFPKTATLTATSYTATGFTAGGVSYSYSDTCLTPVTSFTAITAVFDSYGYVIYTTSVATTANYAYVVATSSTTDAWQVPLYQAKLVYADGTSAIVTTAADYKDYTAANTDYTHADLAGEVVTYSVNTAGKTVLVPQANSNAISATDLSIKTGNASFTFGGAQVANANTVFIVATTDTAGATTFKAYKGIANVPTYLSTATKVGAIYNVSNVAAYVFLSNPTVVGTTTSDKIFVTGVSTRVDTATGHYFVANAVVNGTIKTLNLTTDPGLGVYTVMTTDAAGLVTLGTSAGTAITAITPAANGIIYINTVAYGYATDVAVYTYSATTGAITASSVAAISATSTGWYTVSSTTGLVTGIYLVG